MIVVHPHTEAVISHALAAKNHAVLLHGTNGVGLKTIAQSIGLRLNPLHDASIVVESEDGTKDISIQTIRDLYSATRSTRHDILPVIIDDADLMSLPAQNALLKLLEEPPHGVVFILTSHLPQALLPTIHSRVTSIEVKSISASQTAKLLNTLEVLDTNMKQIMFLAQGKPAEIHRLLNREYFDAQITLMKDAKAIITGTPYERLNILLPYAKDRTKSLQIVDKIGLLLRHTALKTTSYSHEKIETVATAIDSLHANANARIQLLTLAVKL